MHPLPVPVPLVPLGPMPNLRACRFARHVQLERMRPSPDSLRAQDARLGALLRPWACRFARRVLLGNSPRPRCKPRAISLRSSRHAPTHLPVSIPWAAAPWKHSFVRKIHSTPTLVRQCVCRARPMPGRSRRVPPSVCAKWVITPCQRPTPPNSSPPRACPAPRVPCVQTQTLDEPYGR